MRLLGLVLLGTIGLSAQTGTPTQWALSIYPSGGKTALSVTVVTLANVPPPTPPASCNMVTTPPSAPPVENPDTWGWNDPINAGKFCVFTDAARLSGLPDGSYESTVAAVNADGQSPETARVPFTRKRKNPPATPTGAKMIRADGTQRDR